MKTWRRPTLNMTKLMADLQYEVSLSFFLQNKLVLLFSNSLVKPVNILVDFTPGVDKGKIVLVHQVLEHKVHQAWDDRSV